MAFPRLSFKSNIRILSPLSSKAANISTCSNVPFVKKMTKAKRLLDGDNKYDVFQRGRVRYRSFKNTREERKLRSIPAQQIDGISTESKSKSTPFFNTIEDHLQPRKVIVSAKNSTTNSFSILHAKNTIDNKYVTYIQNQRPQSDITRSKKNKSLKQSNIAQKSSTDNDCDNLNDVINTITETQVRYNLNQVRESISLHADCIKDVHDTIVSFKKKNPNYKTQAISTYRGGELRKNVEEIIKFFEEIKGRVIVRNTNALTSESFPPRRYDNTTTDILQSPRIYEMSVKESNNSIKVSPSFTATNVQNEFYEDENENKNENDNDTKTESRFDPPYRSYSEVLSEILKSEPKASAASGLKSWKTQYNSPIFSHTSNSGTANYSTFSKQKMSSSYHALTSTTKDLHTAKSEYNFSTSPTYQAKCGKPPTKTRCDYEEEKKDTKERCFCVQPVNPECQPICPEMPKTAPPLKRLKKVEIPEPKKVCPPPPCHHVVRADDNYKIQPKKLPVLKPSSCPCVEPFVPSKTPSLKRLAPICIPEPEKICPEEKCPPRADDNYKMPTKKLPKLLPSDCPCVEPEIPSEAPCLPRLKLNVPEPPRVCNPCDIEFCCPPRMDEGLKVTQKTLPRMDASDCPCVEPFVPKKMPSLKRLGPVNIIDEPKVCPEEPCPPTMDQMAKFKVEKRRLPPLKISNCPCIEPVIPHKAPPLKRLKKVKIPERPKICPPPFCEDMVRADDNYRIEPKKLPKVPTGSCPCVEPFVPSKSPALKRLPPICIPEPEKICPEEKCPPRADDNYKISPKKLPKMPPSTCPCIEPEIPSEAPCIPRLKLEVPEPPRVCNPCDVEFCCPPRMDDGLKVTQKTLPRMDASDCPCVEPFVPNKMPSLKRLGPVNIIDEPKVCPVEPCPPTMDQMAKFKVERRRLPALKISNCPCIEPVIPHKAPPLKRLKKVKIPERPKICPPPFCEDMVRADDNYRIEPKKLPKVPTGSCPCVEPFVPSKSPALKRLPPICIPEPEKICPEEKCPPRADDNYKMPTKKLPKLLPSDCPCVEPEIPSEAPCLPRLKLNVPEPPRVCNPCDIEFCCPPRMDDGLKVTQKTLPRMDASDCPCVEPFVPKKMPSLKRLGPVNIIDEPKVCPEEPCPPTMDQMAKFKVEKRRLPPLKVSNCPCIEPVIPHKAPPLKRLKKVKIPERPKICPPPFCEDMVRADDNYRIEPKKLPKVPTGSCPCVEPFVPSKSPALKRLPPICIPEPEKICPEKKCPPRADDNYKISPKKLPKMPPSTCPCIEPEIPSEAPCIPRLKLEVPEPPRVCNPCDVEFCCPPRMDDGLKVTQKKLPRMDASDCPCVEPYVPSKAPSMKRLGPVNIIDPPKVCPVDVCPPTMDQIAGYKVKPKKLKTLILNECFNTMSTKEYNERFGGKLHTPKRKFGTKTMFTNFLSKKYYNFYSKNNFSYGSFRYVDHNDMCQPYLLSAYSNSSLTSDDESKQIDSLKERRQDFVRKFSTQCKCFLSNVASTLSSFKNVKKQFEQTQNIQNDLPNEENQEKTTSQENAKHDKNEENIKNVKEEFEETQNFENDSIYDFQEKFATFQDNSKDDKCEVNVLNNWKKTNMLHSHVLNKDLLIGDDQATKSNSKNHSSPSQISVKKEMKSLNTKFKRSSKIPRMACKCGKVYKAKHSCHHRFIYRKRKLTIVRKDSNQINKTTAPDITNSCSNNKVNDETNKIGISTFSDPNKYSNYSTAECNTMMSFRNQPVVPQLQINIYPKKICKVKLNRKRNDKFLTGFKISKQFFKTKANNEIQRSKDNSLQKNTEKPQINCKNKSNVNLEGESSQFLYENFLGMIQRLAKYPMPKEIDEDQVCLKAYLILEILRKLQKFTNEAPKKLQKSYIENQTQMQSFSSTSACRMNEYAHYANPGGQNLLIMCDRTSRF